MNEEGGASTSTSLGQLVRVTLSIDIEVVVVADLFHASFGIMRQVNEDNQLYDTFGSPFVIIGIPHISSVPVNSSLSILFFSKRTELLIFLSLCRRHSILSLCLCLFQLKT